MDRALGWVVAVMLAYAVALPLGAEPTADEAPESIAAFDASIPFAENVVSPVPTLAGRSGEVTVERRGRIRRFSVTHGRYVETWDVFRTGGDGAVRFTAGNAAFVLGGDATAAFDGQVLRLVQGAMNFTTASDVSDSLGRPGDHAGETAERTNAVIVGEALLMIDRGTVGIVKRVTDGSVFLSISSGRVVLSDTRERTVMVEPGMVGVLNAPLEQLHVRGTDKLPADALSEQIVKQSSPPGTLERVLFGQTRSAFDTRFATVRRARNVTDELVRADGRKPLPDAPVERSVANAAFEAAVLSLELERMTQRLGEHADLLTPGFSGLLERRGRALRYIARIVR